MIPSLSTNRILHVRFHYPVIKRKTKSRNRYISVGNRPLQYPLICPDNFVPGQDILRGEVETWSAAPHRPDSGGREVCPWTRQSSDRNLKTVPSVGRGDGFHLVWISSGVNMSNSMVSAEPKGVGGIIRKVGRDEGRRVRRKGFLWLIDWWILGNKRMCQVLFTVKNGRQKMRATKVFCVDCWVQVYVPNFLSSNASVT